MPQSRRRLAAPFMLATLLFMALGAAAFARPNLIQNGGFEHDTSAWTSKGTLTWAPNDANGNLLSGVGKITNSVLRTPRAAIAHAEGERRRYLADKARGNVQVVEDAP